MTSLPGFTIVLRGYDREEVDRYVASTQASPPGSVAVPDFQVVMRGYEPTQVDTYVRSQSGPGAAPVPALTPMATSPEAAPGAPLSPSPSLPPPSFTLVVRGYDRRQVDEWVATTTRRVAELEAALQAATAGR